MGGELLPVGRELALRNTRGPPSKKREELEVPPLLDLFNDSHRAIVEASAEAPHPVREPAPELVQIQRDRLRERVTDLLEERAPDPARLEQEVAILAERGDVAEECDRLQSHLAQFREALGKPEPQGRRLDFLLQEMNREANTIGSKAADALLAHEVVGLKAAIERLREQVQNLE
jgi:uncharacterized protein (TIGR00255 family)